MTSRFARVTSLLPLIALLPAGLAWGDVAPEQVEIAERFAQVGRSVSEDKDAPESSLRVAAGMFDAALRLNGAEKRFYREAADLALRRGDREKAVTLLAGYRKLDSADELAQVQAIDLFVDRMQTAEARADYLQKVAGAEGVSLAVRSHAATAAAAVLKDRGQTAAASALLDQALTFNPLNPKALQVRYEAALATGTPEDRVKALVALLKSNPAQTAVMSALAQELMTAGLFEEAQQWYGRSISVAQQTESVPEQNDLINYAGSLLMTGEPGGASSAAGAVLKSDPVNGPAYVLKLLADRKPPAPPAPTTDPAVPAAPAPANEYAKTLLAARQAAVLRLNVTAAMIALPRDAKVPEIPLDAPLADVRVAARGILDRKRDDLAPGFAAALNDLIWLDLFFEKKPVPAEQLEALQVLLGDQNPAVVRLTGWNSLVAGNAAEAKVKLSAVAPRDPLARLGEILLTAVDSPDAAKSDLATLAAQHPLGETGALLRAAAADMKAPLAPRPEAAALHAAAATFPVKFLDVLTNARDFYQLRAEPVRVAHAYGQAMLLQVTVSNSSEYPLTIGPGGLIGASVTIDASLKGLVTQYVPAVATARLTGKLVLKKGESVSTVVRVDQGQFESFLTATPQPSVTVYLSALTNPFAGPTSIVAGPGGYRAQASRVVERTGTQVASPEARKALFDRFPKASAETRVRNLEMMATLARGLLQQKKDKTPEVTEILNGFTGTLETASKTDPSSDVRASAGFFATVLLDGQAKIDRAKPLLAAEDWEARVYGILAHLGLPKAERAAALTPLAQGDPDELVKRLAQAMIDLPEPVVPATQPAPGDAAAPAGQ